MSVDSVLEYFVLEVEDTGLSFSITPYMNGLIIRGSIIRSKMYYDKLSTFLDEDPETKIEDMDPTTRELFEKYKDNLRKFAKDRLKHSKYESGYIHLEHAIITQCGSDESHAILWRGKMSSIDSFSLGAKPHVEDAVEE